VREWKKRKKKKTGGKSSFRSERRRDVCSVRLQRAFEFFGKYWTSSSTGPGLFEHGTLCIICTRTREISCTETQNLRAGNKKKSKREWNEWRERYTADAAAWQQHALRENGREEKVLHSYLMPEGINRQLCHTLKSGASVLSHSIAQLPCNSLASSFLFFSLRQPLENLLFSISFFARPGCV
jgi:hypothetical protein